MLFDGILQAGPTGMAIGDADLLDAGKVDDAQVKVTGTKSARLDIVFDVVGGAGEKKIEGGWAGRRKETGSRRRRAAAAWWLVPISMRFGSARRGGPCRSGCRWARR